MATQPPGSKDPVGARARRLALPAPIRGWPSRQLPTLNLALQGGGAHGAFTWGVLDRLLEAEGFALEGLSGTSAGALNAVVLASGWLAGGPDGARRALAELWREVGALARFSPARVGGLTQMAADFTAQMLSPYQLNPLGLNPLRRILEQLVDFERLRVERTVQLFVAATHLRTGRSRIFRSRELTAEMVLASACLPQLHQAVEVEGELYWDGGFASNPPLAALVEHCRARDLLLVQINPLEVATLPRTARDIRNRVDEIVFGRPLLLELEQLAVLARRARSPLAWLRPAARRFARHRLHVIDGSVGLARLDPASKIDPDWPRLVELCDLGRAAADGWLQLRAGRRSDQPRSAAVAGEAIAQRRRSAPRRRSAG
jgi:NTE family protein